VIVAQGMVVGFLLALPVGPIGLICIRHTLKSGSKSGSMVGIGAALADFVYAALSSIFFHSLIPVLTRYQKILQFVGGMVLTLLAHREYILYRHMHFDSNEIHQESAVTLIREVFVLTLSNPMTILGFMGVFSGFQINPLLLSDYLLLCMGVFLGSLLWWLCLTGVVTYAKEQLSSNWLVRFCQLSSLMLGCAGLALSAMSLIP